MKISNLFVILHVVSDSFKSEIKLNCMFNCTFLRYDSKFILLKTLALCFPTDPVYCPF